MQGETKTGASISTGAAHLRKGFYSAFRREIPNFETFKQQESTFVLLNLFVLTVLLFIHTIFASYWGDPSKSLIAILGGGFFAEGAELLWLHLRIRPLGPRAIASLGWSSICFNIVLAVALAMVTSRPETQYFVLLVIPPLVAAFRLNFLPMIGVVVFVDLINFFWVWNYARHTLHAAMGEYFEAMTVSIIYAIVGILVWLLVNDLRQKEMRLSESLRNLEQARERALRDEKLAAVGRLASSIAHEVRNPVGAIVSALSTAKQGGLHNAEREEMFQIASKEAGRLERLTSDFLLYARPRELRRTLCSVDDLLGYVAEVCRPRAAEKKVNIRYDDHSGLMVELDAEQIQQVLVNLVMNAVDASAFDGEIELRAMKGDSEDFRIEVTNNGSPISPENEARIFEPFFTTKQAGSGLGLAIARSIAAAHGGDLTLSANEPGRVCFCLSIPVSPFARSAALPEVKWAEY